MVRNRFDGMRGDFHALHVRDGVRLVVGLTELEDEVVVPEPAYRKDELLGYVEHCRKRLDAVMAGMTEAWATSPCPIPYRAMSNGELLLYNMRHVQHHAAQLNMLLRQRTNSAPRWVSKGGQKIKV